MNYTTQMDAARKGIVTPQMEIVAQKEQMPVEKLMEPLPAVKSLFLPTSFIRHSARKALAKLPYENQCQSRRLTGTQQS